MLFVGGIMCLSSAWAFPPEDNWVARPFHFAEPAASPAVAGYSPSQIRAAYNLPSTGGNGTIAIIDAYDSPTALNDLTVFSNQFALPVPTADNFEVHKMQSTMSTDSGWATETALDVEWAHAIAPQAKILLVEARSPNQPDLLSAIDYARGRSDVVAVSMSWGNDEYSSEASYDYHFTSTHGAMFFASSGDNGAGTMWPASSTNVVGIGGTTLSLASDGSVTSETGWSGSGGGISVYETKPAYQANYGITGNRRQIPDVSYNANPSTGVPVYYNGNWYKYGGTSAGAPQWAAIQALGRSASAVNIYQRAGSPANASYLRDIRSGSNGANTAVPGYDCVTGLGSPLTTDFISITNTSNVNYLTLIPTGQSTPLNSTNQFTVNYILNGGYQTAYASNGTLLLNTDPNTNITVAGTSTASTPQEKWVFTSDATPVTGTNITLYYYDLLAQNISYAVVGGGNPQNPSATYFTAPAMPSPQPETPILQLSQTSQTIWPLRATNVSVINPLSANSTEQWSAQIASWNISTSNQIPQQLIYYHQYQTSISYQVIGGGNLTAPTLKATTYGTNVTSNLSQTGLSLWLDACSQYTLVDPITPLNPTERWISNTSSTGYVNTPLTLTANYFYQFSVSVEYSVIGDGTSVAPVFNFINAGNPAVLQLSNDPQTVWIDGSSQYYVQPQLNSSSSTERWFASSNSGAILDASALNFTYLHQFLLNITGAQTNAQWYNSNYTAQVTLSGVLNRIDGTGQRVTAYSLDGGSAVQVEPTSETVHISAVMDAPHQLNINSVTQYQVKLDASAAAQLASITPPTIGGDNYWYDAGSNIALSINGVTTRTGGIGQRVTLVTRNGVATTVASTSVIDVYRMELTGPQSVSASLTDQYLLTLPSGSIRSVTAPAIPDDSGWYDAGTHVTVTYDYTWNSVQNQSRLNAVSYTLSQGSPISLSRSGDGTFLVQVTMAKPENVAVSTIAQYYFAVSGGFNVAVSQNSPTNDSFFDSGTSVSLSSDRMSTTARSTRQLLTSYTLDGATVNVTRTEAVVFTTQAIPVDSAHQLTFNSVTQYMVSFQFKDSSDSEIITPTALQIRTGISGLIDVPLFSVWLDKGTQIEIDRIVWQNVDVKPADSASYIADRPLNLTILCRVFNATLLIQNHLGNPVSGARASVNLANYSTVQAVSGENGIVTLPMIPQGTFNASVSYQGLIITVTGDASIQSAATEITLPPPPIQIEVYVVALIVVLVVVVCAVVLTTTRIRRRVRSVFDKGQRNNSG
jgi:hypothetical protein